MRQAVGYCLPRQMKLICMGCFFFFPGGGGGICKWERVKGCLRKSELKSVEKKKGAKAGGSSHLKGSRLGCLYQPILPGFYSGDERVLKTNRTLRKKLVEQMTVFLVAKPSVLLQQLTEGSVCVFLRGWLVLAGVAGGSAGRRGGCVCVRWGTRMLRANLLGRGGGKLAVTVYANICGRGQAWERLCVAVPLCHTVRCGRVAGAPEWQEQECSGACIRVRSHSCTALQLCTAHRPAAGGKAVSVRPGGAVK